MQVDLCVPFLIGGESSGLFRQAEASDLSICETSACTGFENRR